MTLNLPMSVLGLAGEKMYFEVFASNVMKLGMLLVTNTGLFSSSENLGRGYSIVLLNLIF